jgi:UDPglucose 6-dehydrogenase
MALKVIDALGGDVENLTIAILGLTFKPDTDDMREAPSLPLIETLQRFGARIRAYDPAGIENARELLSDVELHKDPYECARDADALVVVTEWDDIRGLDLALLKKGMRQAILVDLRNAFKPELAQQVGFSVSSIGRPTASRIDPHAMAGASVLASRVSPTRSAKSAHFELVGGVVENV